MIAQLLRRLFSRRHRCHAFIITDHGRYQCMDCGRLFDRTLHMRQIFLRKRLK